MVESRISIEKRKKLFSAGIFEIPLDCAEMVLMLDGIVLKISDYKILSLALRYHISKAEFEEKPSSNAICLWLSPCFLADSKNISRT